MLYCVTAHYEYFEVLPNVPKTNTPGGGCAIKKKNVSKRKMNILHIYIYDVCELKFTRHTITCITIMHRLDVTLEQHIIMQ